MPMYDFKCTGCGHADTEFFKMASENLQRCPKCLSLTYRKQVSLPHTDLKEFSKPIEMFSIAMSSEDEVRAFKRKCPDVECNDDINHPDFGLPVARSRKQKLQALAAAGYVETN